MLTIVDAKKSTYNYGVVVKPVKNVSLFYGHSEIALPVANNFSAASVPAFSSGKQNEFGARVRLLDNRLQAGFTYFDIKQSAYSVPNPANLAVPQPNPLFPPLFSDRHAKGWEFEATYEVSKGFTVIGNFTDFTNRDPNNVAFRGTAERSGATWARYEFQGESFKGLSVSLGVNYLGRRPGDQAGGLTAASTPTNVIPNQPSFWLPARTLVDLSFGYTAKSWAFQANVDNIFDKKYLAASINRFLVYPGAGTNLRVSATYKF